MIIPIIKSIKIRGVRPFNIQGGNIRFPEGVSYFCRENGRGKTTLIDLVKLNLFRLNYIDEYKAVQEKIYPDPGDTKTFDHYVAATWDIDSKKVNIKQELNRSGITSYIDDVWEKEPNFNKALKEIFQTDLNVGQIIELYKILVFIEETSSNKNLIQDWAKFTEEALPELVLEPDKFSFLKDYKHFLRKEKELNTSFTHLNTDFKHSKELLKEFIEEVKAIPTLKDEISRLEPILGEENLKLEALQTKKGKLSEEAQDFQIYQKNLADKRRLLEEISEVKQTLANLKLLESNLGKKSGNIDSAKIKQEYRDSHDGDLCSVCKTGTILSKWDSTIINSQRCPLCKIPLDRVSESIRGEIYQSAANDKNLKRKNKKQIENELKSNTKILNEMKANITALNEKIKSTSVSIKPSEGSIETSILNFYSEMTQVDEQINTCFTKIQGISTDLSKNQNTLGYLDQVRVKIRNKEALRKNKEKLDIVRKDLEYTKEFIKENKDKFDETAKVLDTLKLRIMNFIKSESLRLLNFEFQFDADSLNLILPGGEIRYFNSCSGGEKHFADFCLRVLVWKFLVTEGKQTKGLMILDNPGAIISKSYISLFKEIISKTQDDIQYIITSNNANLYEKDFHLIQELKTKVRTLMDFMA